MCEHSPSIRGYKGDKACAFESAATCINRRSSEGSGDPASLGCQISNVENWARDNTILFNDDYLQDLELVSESTSEHKVYLQRASRRAIKVTLAGFYGQIPVAKDGRLDRANALPSEYLRRMAIHNAVFDSDIRLEGVLKSDKPSQILFEPAGQPSMIISQPWYIKNGVATIEDIHGYLTTEGFKSVPDSYFGWFRHQDGVAIVDAKPDNFIRTEAGIVALDLQLAIFSGAEAKTAKLSTASELAQLYIPR